ncbi:hypothetical protein KAU09_00835 [Candidatus Parcubacteria bacterium]|nr:hypothetical protein [Candidatus Parcubacteria bacterium]
MAASAIKIKVVDEDNQASEKKKKTTKKTVTGKSKEKIVFKIPKKAAKKPAAKNFPVKKTTTGKTAKIKNAGIGKKEGINIDNQKAGDIKDDKREKRKVLSERIGGLGEKLDTEEEKSDIKTDEYVNAELKNDEAGEAGVSPVKNVIAELEKNGSQEKDGKEEKWDKEEKAEESKIYISQSINIYRRIAYFFIFLVIILVGFIAYFSLVKVDIILVPNQERISNNVIFDIYDKESRKSESGNAIIGIVRDAVVTAEKEFESGGNEVIGKEVSGNVVIYNNYTKNQPLVASTRLLTRDGKLFRIRNTINVPSNGSIEVEVYADKPCPEMAVKSAKFTIPGLWAGLQEKIYAETKTSLDYKQKVKKYITQNDVDDKARELKQLLLKKAKEEINEEYKEYSQIIYKINENSVESEIDKKVGDEVDTFNYSMSAEVVVVAFDENKTAKLAKQKFLSALSGNKDLISFDEENIVYSLNNFDTDARTANINASFEGKVGLKKDCDVVEVEKILGLNNEQLEVYLKNLDEIAGYEIKYTPSFIKKVPKLIDRVNIEIKK